MRTHEVICAVWFALVTGCAKDPNECNPRCGRPPDVIDAVVEDVVQDDGRGNVLDEGEVRDVPDADVDTGPVDVDRGEVSDDGEIGIDDGSNDRDDGDVRDGDDGPIIREMDVRDEDVEDVRDGDVVDSDVSTPALTFTFVSGVVSGSSSETTLRAQIVWHGAIRGQSTDGQTKIEAFVH